MGNLLAERVVAGTSGGIHYLVGGHGAPLVLCHGFLGSADSFQQWMQTLCQRRRVIAIDLPGNGHSDPLQTEHTCDALAQAVLDVIAVECPDSAFGLVGVCLGAAVVAAILRLTPGRVREVLLHSAFFEPNMIRPLYRLQVGVFLIPGIYAVVTGCARNHVISTLYKRYVIDGGKVNSIEAEIDYANQLLAEPQAAREWMQDGMRCRWKDTFRAIDVPVLVIAARNDRIVDFVRTEEIVREHRCASFGIIDDAGHGWTEHCTARQLAIIGSFLDANTPRTESQLNTEAS